MFYDYNTIRTHNCIYNFILSNRGGGKTYGAKLLGIKDFLKTGEQFAYVRRYNSEFSNKEQFFDDIIANQEFEGHEFSVKGYKGYCDGKVMCYFIPLSISQKFKSTAYPLVTKIFFDEFIIDKGVLKYLKNEVEVFNDLFETIGRKRDNINAFFLANNVSLVNPYFTYFNVNVNPNKRFSKNKSNTVVVELFTDEDFIEEKLNTRFGQLIKDTNYGQYAINNKSLRDNNAFIIPRPKTQMKFVCSLKLDNLEIGVWKEIDGDIVYLDKKFNPNSRERYAITKDNHTPQYNIITKVKKLKVIDKLKLEYANNNLYFSSQEVKSAYYDILKYI